MFARTVSLFITLLACITTSQATEYQLAIQPILPQAELRSSYQPLADYLSQKTGHTITISTHRTFITYWNEMRKGDKGFDLVLDAAHFTDYRVQKLDYTVLAKMPDTVSFSIITKDDSFILDTSELISKRIATLPSPSLGAVRLEELFPNPMRIPNYVWEINADAAIKSVISGKNDAAIVPTRLVSSYEGLNIVLETEPVPHMGLSASPKVPAEVTDKIRDALVNANTTPEGKEMLSNLKISKFEPADNETYAGYASLLKSIYGY
jgi:phosphonate transport system substrate-binding protein